MVAGASYDLSPNLLHYEKQQMVHTLLPGIPLGLHPILLKTSKLRDFTSVIVWSQSRMVLSPAERICLSPQSLFNTRGMTIDFLRFCLEDHLIIVLGPKQHGHEQHPAGILNAEHRPASCHRPWTWRTRTRTAPPQASWMLNTGLLHHMAASIPANSVTLRGSRGSVLTGPASSISTFSVTASKPKGWDFCSAYFLLV